MLSGRSHKISGAIFSNCEGLSGGFRRSRERFGSDELQTFLKLFPRGHAAAEFVEEVFEEGDVVLRLLRTLVVGRHERHDALAVGREVDVLSAERASDRLLRPQSWFVGHEGVAFYRI